MYVLFHWVILKTKNKIFCNKVQKCVSTQFAWANEKQGKLRRASVLKGVALRLVLGLGKLVGSRSYLMCLHWSNLVLYASGLLFSNLYRVFWPHGSLNVIGPHNLVWSGIIRKWGFVWVIRLCWRKCAIVGVALRFAMLRIPPCVSVNFLPHAWCWTLRSSTTPACMLLRSPPWWWWSKSLNCKGATPVPNKDCHGHGIPSQQQKP